MRVPCLYTSVMSDKWVQLTLRCVRERPVNNQKILLIMSLLVTLAYSITILQSPQNYVVLLQSHGIWMLTNVFKHQRQLGRLPASGVTPPNPYPPWELIYLLFYNKN